MTLLDVLKECKCSQVCIHVDFQFINKQNIRQIYHLSCWNSSIFLKDILQSQAWINVLSVVSLESDRLLCWKCVQIKHRSFIVWKVIIVLLKLYYQSYIHHRLEFTFRMQLLSVTLEINNMQLFEIVFKNGG